MTIKPFAIQGADLTLGGVNLQAGTDRIVIPGVTQATSYRVDEVEDTGEQTRIFPGPPIVIDLITFLDYDTDTTPTGPRAEYIVEELDDDGHIDGIEVTDRGSYTVQESNANGADDLFAYIGSAQDPFATFVAGDWEQIPFRPKMRAGEIETVGGGGGQSDRIINSDNADGAFINNNGDLVLYNDEESGGGVDRALRWDYGAAEGGVDSFIRQDEDGLTVQSYADNANVNGSDIILRTGDTSNYWTFQPDGGLRFPDGTIQTTAYTGQSGSGGSTSTGYIYIMANVDGDIVTSTDGVTWSSPTPSGMVGIDRVAVHGGTIVYAYAYADDPSLPPIVPGLYYSTTIGTVELCTGTDTLEGDNLYWNQVRYFSEPDKWVAVGYWDTTPDEFPAVAYSDDGINWTVVLADGAFVTGFNTDESDWNLTDIAWISETQKYVITSTLGGSEGQYGGIFVTDDLTTALDASVHVAIDLDTKKVAPWPVSQFGGPTGYVFLWDENNDDIVWAGFGTDPEDYYSDSEYWTDSVSQQIGYVPVISEVAYDGDNWIAVTDDGQVIIPIVTMGPPAYTVTVPLPYTTTDFSISRTNPAVLTYNSSPQELTDNEKIVISGSDMFDGTYYWKASDGTLYTDQSLATALDSSEFDPFVSGGTLTMSHGQYFDAAGTAGGYYYIGNDDEQVFRSTNGTTWTQLADVTGEYFNDFAYGTFTTEDSGVSFVQLADGSLQAQASSLEVAALSSALTTGKPTWLSITPRSPDRETLDTHYGFDSNGMWFTGDNEATFNEQPAYPIHTTASFPADATAVVEFDINLVSGEEDWGVCVYPADGIPHWSWEQHPSRIAATVDCSVDGDPYVQANIYGLTDAIEGNQTSIAAKARFTYNPIAEMSTLEVLNSSGSVTARSELPGRLAPGQDYRIGFDADWDDAGPNDKSYFTNLSITVGNTSVTKTTEFSLNGEVKLPSTIKGFVNMAGPWSNTSNNVVFHTVAAHNGFAYIGGEDGWGNNNNGRLDKYSLTTGELVWTRVLGAGRNALFNISWTGGVYTLDSVHTSGVGYKLNEILYITGDSFSGGAFPSNNATITVTEIDGNGAVMTATIAGTAPSGTNSATGVTTSSGDAQGFPLSVEYDTVNDNLVMLSYQDSILTSQASVIRINPTNGDVVGNVTLTDEGDIYPHDLAVHPTTGATAVVGEKRNEYKEFGTLTMLATGNGYFDILKSELDAEHWPGNQIASDPIYNFLISGTGIATTESVDYVNYYEGVSGTTRQGTGAEFAISDDGAGGYTLIGVNNGGSNYRVGHKIKVLGTSLSGATPANDAIVTVTDTDAGAIIAASISGTPGTTGLWTNVTGTNVDVGSGLTLNIDVDPIGGSRIASVNLGGSNYVADDVVIIAGTQFANGATPTNDVEVTITGIGMAGGNVTGVVTGGTTPTNAIRIRVDGVDFTAVGGSWTMKQNLDGEAFVWTPDWNKAIGGGSNDRFQAVVYSKDGASIYAVGNGYYETSYAQSLVVKFATSDGTIEFSKYLNSENTDAYATGVATIGTGDIVVSGYEYRSGLTIYHQFVARMTSSGAVVWKKFYSEGGWGSNSLDQNSDIQVDSDNNIYVTAQIADDNPSWNNTGFTVTKLDSSGNILWTRCLSGNDSSYLGNSNGNRWSSLHGDQLVVAGYTYETADDYYNALWASLPTDGFYVGGESDFVQMGAFRFSQGRIKDAGATTDVGDSFTPSVQPPNITAVTDLKKYETRSPETLFPQHLHKALDPKHGGLVFGDGTRQKTAGDQIPQIKADDDYWITVNDSGKHIYFKNNNGTVIIPAWWRVNLPVGFTFTIVNRTGSDCYVNLEWFPGEVGTILGAGRNIATPAWGIPDSGSGSMVTLIKLEDGHDYNNGGQADGQVWMISGPSDIYDSD